MEELLLSLLIVGSAASAGNSSQCDAKPFSLGKPVPTAAEAHNVPVPSNPRSTRIAAKMVHPKAKPRLFAPCKGAKTKKSG